MFPNYSSTNPYLKRCQELRTFSALALGSRDYYFCGVAFDESIEARSRLCWLPGTCSQDNIYSKSIYMSKHRVYPAIIQKLRNFAFAVVVGESLTKPV